MEEMDFGFLIPISSCEEFSGIGDCKKTNGLCIENSNCYFKQLNIYKQTLKDIKEIAERGFNNSLCNCGAKADLDYIQQKIREVIND